MALKILFQKREKMILEKTNRPISTLATSAPYPVAIAIPKKLLGERSREEVLMVACILDACNSLSLDNLERVLNLGNEYNCVDAVFDVFDEIVMFEYDGGYWHNKDNRNTDCVENDVKKTIERLKKYPDAYMVRLRMFGASPIAEQLRSSDRCILVEPAQKKALQSSQ